MLFGLKKALMHNTSYKLFFSNSFTYNQAEQIKKEVICVQILLEIHLISFSRSDNFLHSCLGPNQQAHDIKMMSMRHDDATQTSVRRHFNVMHLQGSNVVFVL